MKDLFSTQSELYAKYRPVYPAELYEYVLSFVEKRETAWDCATGNGQVARVLASRFQKVFATDISENQLRHASTAENISYFVSPAEQTSFADNSFNLITVGQAYHWFDAPAFCSEATRVARPGAIVAVWGYVPGSRSTTSISSFIAGTTRSCLLTGSRKGNTSTPGMRLLLSISNLWANAISKSSWNGISTS